MAERRECMERETRDASACARRAWLDWRREREWLEAVEREWLEAVERELLEAV